jgi:hypothetical protein
VLIGPMCVFLNEREREGEREKDREGERKRDRHRERDLYVSVLE